MTPADCLAIVFAAGVALFVGYRFLVRWAARTITESIGAPEATYQPRCSTTPVPSRLAIWLAFGIAALVIGEFALPIARAYGCGQ